MAARGIDVTRHVSRPVTAEELEGADLVIAMSRRHLRNAVATDPDVFPRTFTLKELVRRAAELGARRDGEPLGDWLSRLHEERTTQSLLGDDPIDDIADPIGGPDHAYETTAAELEGLLDRLATLAFGATGATTAADRRESA